MVYFNDPSLRRFAEPASHEREAIERSKLESFAKA